MMARMRTLIRYITKRWELYGLRRKARTSWEQTLTYLQSDSAVRRVGVRGKAVSL